MAVACRIILNTTFLPSLHSLHKTHKKVSYSQPFLHKRHPAIQCSISTSSDTKAAAKVSETVPWGCDIDSLENAEALQKWLSDSGLPPQKMAIQKVEVGERGLVALKNIRKGEMLLFVPPSLVIAADSVNPSSFSSVHKRKICYHWQVATGYNLLYLVGVELPWGRWSVKTILCTGLAIACNLSD